MSADNLRGAVISALELEAGQVAQAMCNMHVVTSCEQIALKVAELRGMTIALKRSADIVMTEYKRLVQPEEAAPKTKKAEIY